MGAMAGLGCDARAAARNGLLLSAALGLCLAVPAGAADRAEQEPAEGKEAPPAEPPDVAAAPDGLPVYRPPARGKPRSRVGGAVRSGGREWPALTALVPEHTGLTVSERPSLFWHVDETLPAGATLVFALIDEEHIDPMVEVELAAPQEAGIQRIDLTSIGVALLPGPEYQWSVALVVDAQQRARDLVAVGYVQRVEVPTSLSSLGSPSVADYAAHGLWYDALAAADEQIRKNPEGLAARRARDGLLRQAGLEAALPDAAN